MLKFLRKYNKIILVVGGVFLMIAFLLPQTLTQLGQRGLLSPTFLKIGGKKVSVIEAQTASKEYMLIRELMGPVISVESVEHWVLLTHAAKLGGYIADKGDGDRYEPILIDQLAQTIANAQFQNQYGARWRQFGFLVQQYEQQQEQLRGGLGLAAESVRQRARLTDDEYRMTLAKARGVMRMFTARRDSLRFSRPRLLAENHKLRDQANIDYVFIPADARTGEVEEPNDAQVQELFDRYKDNTPADGEFGIGYTLPPRVKVEWLTLNSNAISDKMKLDPIELSYRFKKANPDPAAFENDEARTTARQQVETDYRAELTKNAMDEAVRAIIGELERAHRPLQTDDDGFKILPADWDAKRPTMEALAKAAQDRVRSNSKGRLSIPMPTVERRDDAFLTATDLSRLTGGIQAAALQRGRIPIGFAQLALLVHELDVPAPEIQLGVVGPSISDGNNIYFFRVLDARPQSPPDDIAEIRDTVVRDWKRLQSLELLKSDTEFYTDVALSQGLQALVDFLKESAPEETAAILSVRQGGVTRENVFDRQLNTEEFRDRVMDIATTLDPAEPPLEEPVAGRLVAMPIESSVGFVVANITSFRPLVLEDFRVDQGSLANQLHLREMTDSNERPFSLKELVERYDVTLSAGAAEALLPDEPADDGTDDEA